MFEQRAVESIAILLVVIFLGTFLRSIRVLEEKHGDVFAGLITKVTIPALIFSALSCSTINMDKLLLAAVMIISQFICGLLAWGIAGLMKLSRPVKGAMILGSAFPSSAFLGYAVVKEIYAGNPEALADAAIVSELGVAISLFTAGIFVAIHYGSTERSSKQIRKEIGSFLYSPIFISLVLGIGFSFVNIPKGNIIINGFYETLHLISNANTFLVAMTIGLMLHFRQLKNFLYIVILVVLIKLIVQPLLSFGQALLFDFEPLWRQIVILEASMPTAAMTAIFAKRFGDDADLTSILVFATFISSCLTMIMMVVLLG